MKRKGFILLVCLVSFFLVLTGCALKNKTPFFATVNSTQNSQENSLSQTESKMKNKENAELKMQIGNYIFTATLEDNAAADAFFEMVKQAPLTIKMSDYSGFEKVGSLGVNLPTSSSWITANEGDIVLYNENQIVIFYGSNSWSYTRLGKIDDLSGWKDALGHKDITVTFFKE